MISLNKGEKICVENLKRRNLLFLWKGREEKGANPAALEAYSWPCAQLSIPGRAPGITGYQGLNPS